MLKRLNLIEGCKIISNQEIILNTGYEKTKRGYRANVDSDKIRELMKDFISYNEPSKYFMVLELPLILRPEERPWPYVLDTKRHQVYYLNDLDQETINHILFQYGDILIQDGVSSFGFVALKSGDEMFKRPFNEITLYTEHNYDDFLKAHDLDNVGSLSVAESFFDSNTQGLQEKVKMHDIIIDDVVAELKKIGLYFSQNMEI